MALEMSSRRWGSAPGLQECEEKLQVVLTEGGIDHHQLREGQEGRGTDVAMAHQQVPAHHGTNQPALKLFPYLALVKAPCPFSAVMDGELWLNAFGVKCTTAEERGRECEFVTVHSLPKRTILSVVIAWHDLHGH